MDLVNKRIQLTPGTPGPYKAMLALSAEVHSYAENAGLGKLTVELVKLRASQMNGCAFCLDMHSHETLKLGEDPRRIFVLDGWRETELFSDEERAALALTEEITRIGETQSVSDAVYAEATSVLTEDQYRAVAWLAVVINSFNRLAVTSHKPLPRKA
nr:carboxymuconolactone decarboxylase family protein [Amycolatopsis xylanica]